MPMKCMAQMPPPMLNAPASTQATRLRSAPAPTTRSDTDRATNADSEAIANDRMTRPGWYAPT